MNLKESILKLRKEGKKYNEIKDILGCSKSNISFHCKNNNLGNSFKSKVITDEIKLEIIKLYEELKSSYKVSERLNVSRNTVLRYVNIVKKETQTTEERKKKISDNVIKWRKRTKIKLVEYKGGECEKCGYDKCMSALEFHHLDPNKKDFTISGKSWRYDRLKLEVDKCILVCSNCHKEIHEGLL